jgi:AmiR/NasT family two-component response regulator
MLILIVEDEVITAMLIKAILSKAGHEVVGVYKTQFKFNSFLMLFQELMRMK